MDLLKRLFGARTMLFWAIATLVVQSGIIVTGATVRLTGSGLGCPTWPRCTDESYLPHAELGWHGVIEFGNRLLTFVLIIVAFATFFAAVATRRSGHPRGVKIRNLSIAIALGVPLQAVVGGITVLTGLDPNIVSPHLLLSVVLVALSTWLLVTVVGAARQPVGPIALWLVRLVAVGLVLAIWLGTVVTGAGPHSGDAGAHRNGLEIEVVARLHSASVWPVVIGTVILVAWLRSRAAVTLLCVLLLQGLVGYLQYFNGLPVGLVILHMIGIPLCTAAGVWLLLSVRQRSAPVRAPIASDEHAAPRT